MNDQLMPEGRPTQTIYIQDASALRTFLASVFSYMTMALVISGAMAWWFGHDLSLMQYLIDLETGTNTMLGWIVMFAPLGLIFLMGGMVNKMSHSALLISYVVFSAIMGISFSYIFLIYSASSIFKVFFMTAGVFGIMAVAGYTTKTDLTKLGSILFIGLIGIIIASIVNIWLGSGTMDFIISILGIVIFTGLTAYDMQRLKAIGQQAINGTEETSKMALMGSLSLYLNFINLFLILLRFFGSRD